MADRRELEAAGTEPLTALVEGVAGSDAAFTALDGGGRPVLMFGVAPWPEAPEIGAPWLLASDGLADLRQPFLRRCRGWTARLGHGRRLLANFVDERNALHLRWLRWCGFRFIERCAGYGRRGEAFLGFAKLTLQSELENSDVRTCFSDLVHGHRPR